MGFFCGCSQESGWGGKSLLYPLLERCRRGGYLDEDSYVANPRACVALNGEIVTPLGYFADVIRAMGVTKKWVWYIDR